ncbi:uncharacterized protein LOC123524736 [Mercenaria mercenaria]|uniref:uncharacterized protein LOC123524736 n=1 Tax=Mercenaria mercenaria TaxID=6596 RepID=UPI00234F1884|nr:uncharacterized protein LOC123524736 [Mercenaria mercenaria]
MAISPKYENFSFVGSKEDLFTKYKRKCTDATIRQKRSKYITTGVVLFLLVALVIGLSIGLHVTKSAEKVESSGDVDTHGSIETYDENNTVHINGKLSSALLLTETVTPLLNKEKSAGEQDTVQDQESLPCSNKLQCP